MCRFLIAGNKRGQFNWYNWSQTGMTVVVQGVKERTGAFSCFSPLQSKQPPKRERGKKWATTLHLTKPTDKQTDPGASTVHFPKKRKRKKNRQHFFSRRSLALSVSPETLGLCCVFSPLPLPLPHLWTRLMRKLAVKWISPYLTVTSTPRNVPASVC